MEKYWVQFLPGNEKIEVAEGTTLLEAQRQAGLEPDAPCGGQGKCKKCQVEILDGPVTGLQLACQVEVKGPMAVRLLHQSKGHRILTAGLGRQVEVKPWDRGLADQEKAEGYLAAFDVGTTSIVGYLLDPETGEETAVTSHMNPQAQYGADVIMRCNYALSTSKEALSQAVRKELEEMLGELAAQAQIPKSQITQIGWVGNTCMHHLFLELPTNTLVLAPYKPAEKEEKILEAAEYGLHIHPQGKLLMLPCIDGFVGADTVGCLVATAFDDLEPMTLMIDIGTNGEMVLGNKDRMVSCSTAAGPAFEGAKITCGMRGAAGAIDHIHMKDKKLEYTTIGGEKAKGICGSGLMDAVSLLLKNGFVEESGRFFAPEEMTSAAAAANRERMIEKEGKPAFSITPEVYLTQKDIREVQLAKGAIAAGIHILCRTLGISPEEIEQVLIAGAFGNYMSPESACDIGLIPSCLRGRIQPIGNAAGEGAKIAVLNHQEYLHAQKLADMTEMIELAAEPDFQDCFVDELEFPMDFGE